MTEIVANTRLIDVEYLGMPRYIACCLLEGDGPAIIDFVVEQEENVYPMIPSGATVHDMLEEPRPQKARR